MSNGQAGPHPPAGLRSNGVPVGLSDDFFAPMRDSTDLLGVPNLLRKRYQRDGYVLIRGLLDRAVVRALRAAYFAQFPAGYLRQGTDPADGIWSGQPPRDLPPYGVAGHPAHEFVRSAAFAEFTGQPRLAGLAQVLLGGPCTLLPRRVLRHFDAGSKQATRAHVDRAYPSGAGSDLVTLWIPLGDCPAQTGGLVYLEGSHRIDPAVIDQRRTVTDRPGDPRPISHDLAWTARALNGRWLWTDFLAGDVAAHCPDIVHASLDTATQTMRLSADIRFQRTGLPVLGPWSTYWSADDGG